MMSRKLTESQCAYAMCNEPLTIFEDAFLTILNGEIVRCGSGNLEATDLHTIADRAELVVLVMRARQIDMKQRADKESQGG